MIPCSRCGDTNPAIRGRDKHRPDGFNCYCNPCNAARRREWRAKNIERYREMGREKRTEWVGVTFERPLTRAGARIRLVRLEAIAAYGGQCACCGEVRQEFLTIDHINGGGNKHRKALNGSSVFDALKREGFPKDRYRLLCYNCNCALAHRGYCPHERERVADVRRSGLG